MMKCKVKVHFFIQNLTPSFFLLEVLNVAHIKFFNDIELTLFDAFCKRFEINLLINYCTKNVNTCGVINVADVLI